MKKNSKRGQKKIESDEEEEEVIEHENNSISSHFFEEAMQKKVNLNAIPPVRQQYVSQEDKEVSVEAKIYRLESEMKLAKLKLLEKEHFYITAPGSVFFFSHGSLHR